MPIPNSLRFGVIALSLALGAASAQAALTMVFEEDVASGQIRVVFGGEAESIIPIPSTPVGSAARFTANEIVVTQPGNFFTSTAWFLQGERPWTNGPNGSLISSDGTGGLLFTSANQAQLYTSTTGNKITWNGSLLYDGTLNQIGVTPHSDGTLVFTNGPAEIRVNWSAVVIPVPEPATYAAVLGLGVAGIALLRRRASRR